MPFNSLTFLIFSFFFLVAYWFFIKKRKIKLLLIFTGSLFFYGMAEIRFVALILFCILFNYYSAIYIYNLIPAFKKKILLLFTIFLNLAILAIFKYYFFFSKNINLLLDTLGLNFSFPVFNFLLPIGISFFTFQNISYIIDIFKKKIKPEKNFFLFANYILFFPQLVAGPILRASEIISQFSKQPVLKLDNMYNGLKRLTFGLFLKFVIADNLGPLVDKSYSTNIDFLSGVDVFTMSYLFGFQIYFDFSAYSHIAIGIALLMNIKLPENFNSPYHSLSPKEFWTKWHISLSSWVRDYIYLPMLSYKSKDYSTGGFKNIIVHDNLWIKTNLILIFTWCLMGFWHGPNWKFIIWGFIHSQIIITSKVINKLIVSKNNKYYKFLGWFFTLQVIMLSWIPFRTNNVSETFKVWGRLFDFNNWTDLSFNENTYLVAFVITAGYFLLPYILKSYKVIFKKYLILNLIIEMLLLFILMAMIIIFFQQTNQFIYFQF